MSTITVPAAPAVSLSADPDAGNCDTGRPNLAGYRWGQPYVCPCGSVGSFPCNCERSRTGAAA